MKRIVFRDVVSRKANADRVPPDGVHIVVSGGACTANHGEGVLEGRKECVSALRHAYHAAEGTHAVKVERVLFVDEPSRDFNLEMTERSVYTLPGGRRDCAVAFATQDLQEDRNTGLD